MKYKVSFVIVCFLLLSIQITSAQVQKLDVNVEIVTYEIKDAYVVGDSFYYNITFTNRGSEPINDTFTISISNPSRILIDRPRNYEIHLKPNESRVITAEGGKENETAVFPFDTSGDYKIEIKSTKPIDFYRWITTKEGTFFIRQNKNFHRK